MCTTIIYAIVSDYHVVVYCLLIPVMFAVGMLASSLSAHAVLHEAVVAPTIIVIVIVGATTASHKTVAHSILYTARVVTYRTTPRI